MSARRLLAAILFSVLGLTGHAAAQDEEGARKAQALQAAVEGLQKVLQPGPVDVKLAGPAVLGVPQGASYVRQPEAGAWAAASDYPRDARLVGLLVPRSEQNWVVFIDYHDGVRIGDAEARDWDAAALLSRLRASTEAGNAAREKRGEPQLEVKKWLVTPGYDAGRHTLIWGAVSPEKGGEEDEGTANVHGYALGSEGYFELNLVTPAAEAASYVSILQSALAGLRFETGSRYQDRAPASTAPERTISSLIAPAAPGTLALASTWLAANWIWLAGGLLVLLVLAGSAMRALRR